MKFFYATVIGTRIRYIEPIKIQDHPDLGKEPIFCCDEMMKAINLHQFMCTNSLRDDSEELYVAVKSNSQRDYAADGFIRIEHCPFCAAKIFFIANLVIEKIEEKRMTVPYEYTHTYYKIVQAGSPTG